MNFIFNGVHIRIAHGDALLFKADVLALKFANDFYGVDRAAAAKISKSNPEISSMFLDIGEIRIFSEHQSIAASHIMFVGVGSLYNFEYNEIKKFSKSVIRILSKEIPNARHIALTLHGVGYGLDERESFKAEIAGLIEAIGESNHPQDLQYITIVEHNAERATRLIALLDMFAENILRQNKIQESHSSPYSEKFIEDVSNKKPYIFVAMPFSENMDDVFHYGIHKAISEAGFLCERADLESFTGDVLNWIKNRIEKASLVVADLSGANPNVYLEVGYAWGCEKQTVLITNSTSHLKFDVRGQKCILYKNIKDLEKKLHNEISKICKRHTPL